MQTVQCGSLYQIKGYYLGISHKQLNSNIENEPLFEQKKQNNFHQKGYRQSADLMQMVKPLMICTG